MKKNIVLWCIISLIVIVIFICCILKYNNKKKNNIIKDLSANTDNVLYVEMKEETEGGYIYYKTEEKQLIEQIVNAINKIEIKEKTDLMFSDNTRTYILKLNNGTELKYCFQNNYYHKDNINYKIYNYEELMKIKIPREILE